MLPKVYGERVTREHSAPGGGPVAFVMYGQREADDAETWQQDNPPPPQSGRVGVAVLCNGQVGLVSDGTGL